MLWASLDFKIITDCYFSFYAGRTLHSEHVSSKFTVHFVDKFSPQKSWIHKNYLYPLSCCFVFEVGVLSLTDSETETSQEITDKLIEAFSEYFYFVKHKLYKWKSPLFKNKCIKQKTLNRTFFLLSNILETSQNCSQTLNF